MKITYNRVIQARMLLHFNIVTDFIENFKISEYLKLHA